MRQRYDKLGTINRAIRCASLAQKKNPENPYTYLEHGQALWSRARCVKNDEEYAIELTIAEEKFIESQRIWAALPALVLSRFYRQTYRPIMALAMFDEYEKRERNRRRFLSEVYILGEAAFQLSFFTVNENIKNYYLNRAYHALRESKSAGYENARILISLALIEASLGKPEFAEETLSKLANNINGVAGSWNNLIEEAKKLIENKEYEILKKSFALGITESSVWNILGTYARKFLINNDYAIKLYETGITLQPRNAIILTNISNALLSMGSTEDLVKAEKYITDAGNCADRNYRWWRAVKQQVLQAQGKRQKPRLYEFDEETPSVQFKYIYSSFEFLKQNKPDDESRNDLFSRLFQSLLKICLGVRLHPKKSEYISFDFRAKSFYTLCNWEEKLINANDIISFKNFANKKRAFGIIMSMPGISEELHEILYHPECNSIILFNDEEIENIFKGSIRFEVILGIKVRESLKNRRKDEELDYEDDDLFYDINSPLADELYFFTRKKTKDTELIKLVLSYALEDKNLIIDLQKYLNSIKNQGIISFYDLRKMKVQNTKEAKKYLRESTLNLIVISNSFMSSKQFFNELQSAIEYFEKGENHIVPILLKDFNDSNQILSGLKCLPSNGMPIYHWSNLDEAWMELFKDLDNILQNTSP